MVHDGGDVFLLSLYLVIQLEKNNIRDVHEHRNN